MAREPVQPASLFSQIDVPAAAPGHAAARASEVLGEQTRILSQILAAQDRQNELLEELIGHLGSSQRQRAAELNQWRQANPRLATACRRSAELLARVQSEFLERLTAEVQHQGDDLIDGDFLFNEFIDRFGPRLAHLNGVLQLLSQLSAAGEPSRDD